ncbi:MAG: pilin protein [Selenomonadaceae bacterium]|nr:pilin protein [Selenomonadaceae bacterium]
MKEILEYLKIRYVDPYLGEKGQGMVEYALILAFVVVIAGYLVGNDNIGEKIKSVFQNVGTKLDKGAATSGN